MGDRIVVHSLAADCAPASSVADRIQAAGLGIVEIQPNMLLVEGDAAAAKQAIADIRGWGVTAETMAPPRRRERVLRPSAETEL